MHHKSNMEIEKTLNVLKKDMYIYKYNISIDELLTNEYYSETIFISAKTKENIETLKIKLHSIVYNLYKKHFTYSKFKLPLYD